MTPLELSSPIALTAEGIAWVLASLVAILLFGLARAHRVRRDKAAKEYQRRADARRRS